MKVAIIGAGFTGLAAAFRLAQLGHMVSVFEKNSRPGGLAIGFHDPAWKWSLEEHYHHLFVSDYSIRNLAKEVGHKLIIRRPVTSTYINGQIHQLDSPLSLLLFPGLPLLSKLRTGITLAYLKLVPFWKILEGFTAKQLILSTMGKKSWEVLWEPLFRGKFGSYADEISAVWFWSRIYKRSSKLLYPERGFQALAESIKEASEKAGAKFKFNISIENISKLTSKFDKVICTLPTPHLEKISNLTFPRLTGIGAVNLVLALKKQFLNNMYWLNVNDRSFPFISVVEHTNFMDKDSYGKEHLVYVGNYFPPTHPYFQYSPEQLLTEYFSYLKKINPKFEKAWVKKMWIFKAPFAQPIVTTYYSKKIPPIMTNIPNLYLANIQQVYPWDRGTNYAVELGQKVASMVTSY